MSRSRCCCCCNNNRCGSYGGYGGYGCGGYGGYGGNSCCNFSCLIILILILLFFSRKRCHKPGCSEEGEGIGRRCEGLDGGIIFVITLFYLCCCSPCGGRCR